MTQEESIALLKEVVQGQRRHKHYYHTVKRADEYKAFITGKGMDKYVKKVSRRETDEAWKQRLDITIHISETICSELIDPEYKLPRSNSIERTFLYTDNNRDKHNELTSIMRKFWDNKYSVDRYMGRPWIELNNIDPNAFVVIDWKTNDDGSRIRPYPVEYMSSQVIDYREVNGVLKWIVLHRPEEGEDPEMYLLYTPSQTIIFRREYYEEWSYASDIEFFQEFPVKDFQAGKVAAIKMNTEYYDMYVPKPHNLGYIPGFFVGFATDLETRRTYVSAIHKAIPILKKITKANSEQDISMAFHAFPQKIQYVKPCPECGGNVRGPDGNICTKCQGSGIDHDEVHQSGQDVLLVPRPKDKEDMIELDKMIHYVGNDVKLLKFLDDVIEKWTKKCKQAVYNSEVFSRPAVSETAYSKNVDLQNVYDALWPMAEAYSTTYNFIVDTIADITDLKENLVHNLSFRKDFKMKSPSDLYQDLAVVGQASASEFVKRDIENDIAQIMYEDDPRELRKYYTQNHFFPFNGKTKEEIRLIIASPLIPKKIKVLWANFSYLFDEIELDQRDKNIDFYMLSRDKQKEILDAKVEALADKLEDDEPIMIPDDTEPVQRGEEGEREAEGEAPPSA